MEKVILRKTYNDFIKEAEGMYIAQFQQLNDQLMVKFAQKKTDLKDLMKSNSYLNVQHLMELYQDRRYNNQKTICVDIIDTVVIKVDLPGLFMLKQL